MKFDLSHIFASMGLVGNRIGGAGSRRFDANDTAFLNRQIEFVRAKIFETLYLDLQTLQFVPLATDIPPWVSHVVEIQYDDNGQARVVASGADDLPRVDTAVSESTYRVVTLAAAYGWTIDEMRQAAATQVPLSERKSRMGRVAIETGVDEFLAFGGLPSVSQAAASFGMTGLINNASVPVLTSLANGSSWQDLNADKIYADLVQLREAPKLATGSKFLADTILLAPREYSIASNTRMSTFDSRSVLRAFLENNPGVTAHEYHRLTNNGAGGTTNRQMSFKRSPDVLEGILPVQFEQLAPQQRNFEVVTAVRARCGGVQWHHPKGAAYVDLDASSV